MKGRGQCETPDARLGHFDRGPHQQLPARRDSIGAITSRCGRENLGATPSLGTFFSLNFSAHEGGSLLGFLDKGGRLGNQKVDWSGIRTHASEETSA